MSTDPQTPQPTGNAAIDWAREESAKAKREISEAMDRYNAALEEDIRRIVREEIRERSASQLCRKALVGCYHRLLVLVGERNA